MISLHLRILGSCNLSCEFCSYPVRETPFDLRRSMREVEDSGAPYVQVSGGEPLTAPPLGLIALLEWLRARGKTVELQTNGMLVPGYPEKLLRRVASLVHLFNVNFSAHAPALDLAVTRTPGAFRAREGGVDRLLALGAQVRLTYVVYARNYRQVAKFPDYVARRLPGVSWIQFSFVKGMGRAQGDARLIPRHEAAAPFLREALRRCARIGLHCEVDHIPAGYVREFVNQHVDTHKAFWGLDGYHRKDKVKTARCASCSLASTCPGERRDYLEVYG